MVPQRLQTSGAGSDRLENIARAALDAKAGRPVTDAEWAATSSKLLEYAGILRIWDRKTIERRRGKVKNLCQQEQ